MLNFFVVDHDSLSNAGSTYHKFSDYTSSEDLLILRIGHRFTRDISKADALLFIGGADIDPSFYKEENVASTVSRYSDTRDQLAYSYYQEHRGRFKIAAGICRGGQFLNAMSGGSMWQDVNNHTRPHDIVDLCTGKVVRASSTHHQMMRPSAKGEIIATSTQKLSTYKLNGKDGLVTDDDTDVEVVWYKDTQCLCFQPHPEYGGYDDLTEYFGELINRYVNQ